MEENKLAELFYKFLEDEKGFPKTSLLKHAPAYNFNGRRTQIDLLLLDVRIGNYIGLVEFKLQISPQIKANVKAQTDIYSKAIKSEGIPIYLVYPINEQEFQILVYGEDDWVSISKQEFPEFETLSAKKKIEEKIESRVIEEKNINILERKRESKQKSSIWVLTSLIIGVLTSLLASYVIINFKNPTSISPIIDSQILMKIDSLETKLSQMEKIYQKSFIDTILVVDSTNTYSAINLRLKKIENGIFNDGEKTLALKNTNQQIELLRQELSNKEKLIELKNENLNDRIDLLNALFIGMILTLFTAGIGTVINNFYVRKSDGTNN